MISAPGTQLIDLNTKSIKQFYSQQSLPIVISQILVKFAEKNKQYD